MILVLTGCDDTHLAFVSPHIKSELLVIDPLTIGEGNEQSFLFERDRPVVTYANQIMDDVRSVWYRKPSAVLASQLSMDKGYKPYAMSALANHFADLRMQFERALWISDYYAIRRAENKMWQLLQAASLGFLVPDTLATSDAGAAEAFRARHDAVIVKPRADAYAQFEDGAHIFPATRVMSSQKVDLSGLKLAPAIFQQAIESTRDIRVTVVGDQAFVASIEDASSDTDNSIRDYRIAHVKGLTRFQTFSLRDGIRQACIDLVKKMGLCFGAIDLVMDELGRVWFLEVNPNGQWAFVEEETGLPIGKAIADLLEKGNS